MRSIAGVIIVIFFFAAAASGHKGKTDRKGGHVDKKTGEYHYHPVKVVKTPPSKSSEENADEKLVDANRKFSSPQS